MDLPNANSFHDMQLNSNFCHNWPNSLREAEVEKQEQSELFSGPTVSQNTDTKAP